MATSEYDDCFAAIPYSEETSSATYKDYLRVSGITLSGSVTEAYKLPTGQVIVADFDPGGVNDFSVENYRFYSTGNVPAQAIYSDILYANDKGPNSIYVDFSTHELRIGTSVIAALEEYYDAE